MPVNFSMANAQSIFNITSNKFDIWKELKVNLDKYFTFDVCNILCMLRCSKYIICVDVL